MSKDDYRLNSWLTQSGIPRKVQEISGVSRTTVLDLKSQAEKVKSLAQGLKNGTVDPGERRRRGIDLSSLGPKNAGVQERDERDKQLQLNEDKSTWRPEMAEVLAKKAEKYELLQSGRLKDDEGLYEVDFLLKERSSSHAASSISRPESNGSSAWDGAKPVLGGMGAGSRGDEPVDTAGLAVRGTGGMRSADMDRERERRQWEAEQDRGVAETERKRQYKEAVLDIHEDALEAQEEARRKKRVREVQAQARLEVYKQQIVKNKVQQLVRQRSEAAEAMKLKKAKKAVVPTETTGQQKAASLSESVIK